MPLHLLKVEVPLLQVMLKFGDAVLECERLNKKTRCLEVRAHLIKMKVICNVEWFLNYPHCEVEVSNPHISDYFPLKVKMDTNLTKV